MFVRACAAGVFDYIKRVNAGSTLVGFLMGPHGVYTGAYTIIDDVLMARYRNMGVRASFTFLSGFLQQQAMPRSMLWSRVDG